MTFPADIDAKKTTAAAWFRQVRDDLCARLEAIEDDGGEQIDRTAGRFEIKPWSRPDGGGGEIGLALGTAAELPGTVEVALADSGSALAAPSLSLAFPQAPSVSATHTQVNGRSRDPPRRSLSAEMSIARG